MIAAFRELAKIIPVEPIDQAGNTKKSEWDHSEQFQPRQIMGVQGDFVYQGQASTRLGQLPSVTEDVEGEFEEL